jgi:hypothetical protein
MTYSPRFDEALAWASELHRDQTRKGKDVPYINHLIAVASLVGSNGGDEDQVIGALLHDAIEDCIGDVPDIQEQIREKFGERVLEVVEGCTDAYQEPKPPWPERKQSYLDHLRELPDDSPVLLVSLSDKVHNARSILRDLREHGDELWDRFKGKHAGTLWYYNTLAGIFEQKQPVYLAVELRRVVEAMKVEGDVPEILTVPDTDNSLLVDLLQDRLDDDWTVLNALDYLVIEAPGHADFLAEIEPTELTVRAWLHILPDEDLPGDAFGTDAAAQFESRALEALECLRNEWRGLGFEAAEEPSLCSPERGVLTYDSIACSQLVTRRCDTLEDVVAALAAIDEHGVVVRLPRLGETSPNG